MTKFWKSLLRFFTLSKRERQLPEHLANHGIEYKHLRYYSNKELLRCLELNDKVDLGFLAGIVSEILRRMNEKSKLL